jgi:signal transduction histidine kinase
VYSPPEKTGRISLERDCHVETVVDIGPDLQDWTLVFEKGGIRRVLMNLFGNSLKFTSVSTSPITPR